VQTWGVHAFAVEPLTLDFPYARTMVVIRSERTLKKTGQGTQESRYYLSNRLPEEHTSAQWLSLIRGHWAGVENRNHWRRDALMGEDRSRSRNPKLLANLALIRNVLLSVLEGPMDTRSLPETRELLQRRTPLCLKLLTAL
jgi:predicted transposase YbfD/YdcC